MDKREQQHLKAGIFVLSGIILLLTLLFFLGLSDFFTRKITMQTGFRESVQGLSRGSAVKYRGVQIGTVKDISILVEENIILVEMEIDPDNFLKHRRNHPFSDAEFKKFIYSEIAGKGLRARLEMLGITGMRYIDFDYFASPGAPVPPAPKFSRSSRMLYIPGVTSQLKDVTQTLTLALDRISKIHFERISEHLEDALLHLGQLLNSREIKSTISRLNDTAANLEKSSYAIVNVLNEERLLKLTGQLEKTFLAVTDLKNIFAQIAADAKIPETTASFRQAMDVFSEQRPEVADALTKLDQTLEAIRTLAEYLSTDPSSLLRGKNKEKSRQSR
ncbi:MAG: MCE family protein [Lentisphaeria bacterium]|nr:MCE family protein [Lentisphaeria bacterium]